MKRQTWALTFGWLVALAAGLGPATAAYGQDCQGAPACACQSTCPNCRHCRHHACGHHCACELPHGVILPSAPALYFGASTLSIAPAGFNAQAFAAPQNRFTDTELQQLLRLLQSQAPTQGFGAPGCSAAGSQGAAAPGSEKQTPYGAGAPSPQPLESRLAQVEAEIRELQARVQEHTEAFEKIIKRDPALLKLFRADPSAPTPHK